MTDNRAAKRGKRFRTGAVYLSFVLPALIFYLIFFIYPSAGSVYFSFTDWHGLESRINFVGFDNYIAMFQDEVFFDAVEHTLIIMIVVVVVQNFIAILFANLLNHKFHGRNFCRTALFLPCILSPLSIGFIWSYILNPEDGILNVFLQKAGLSFLSGNWLGNPNLALFSIIVIIIWQNAGYSMVIYMAGLNSIPGSYYEAAKVDGASPWQIFRNISLPLIAPSITINVLLSVIGCMKTFDIVYATTGGGPGHATETIATLLFSKAFSGNYEYGYAAAIAIVLFAATMLLSQTLTRILRAREVDI